MSAIKPCLAWFTATRIRECCTLLTADIYTPKGQVRPRLIIRKANTKGKLATRSIPVIEDLRKLLADYHSLAGEKYLFPGGSARSGEEMPSVILFRLSDESSEVVNDSLSPPTLNNWRLPSLDCLQNRGLFALYQLTRDYQ